jgi:hypothetical protein
MLPGLTGCGLLPLRNLKPENGKPKKPGRKQKTKNGGKTRENCPFFLFYENKGVKKYKKTKKRTGFRQIIWTQKMLLVDKTHCTNRMHLSQYFDQLPHHITVHYQLITQIHRMFVALGTSKKRDMK